MKSEKEISERIHQFECEASLCYREGNWQMGNALIDYVNGLKWTLTDDEVKNEEITES